MDKVIHFGYGEAMGIFRKNLPEPYYKKSQFVYAKFMTPSYLDEHVYAPAESVHITLDKKRLIELRDILNEFIEELAGEPMEG